MTTQWRCYLIRFDGMCRREKVEEPPPASHHAHGWSTILRTDHLHIEEWIGPQEPGYYQYAIYVHLSLLTLPAAR